MFRCGYEKRYDCIFPDDKRHNRDMYDGAGAGKIIQLYRIIK